MGIGNLTTCPIQCYCSIKRKNLAFHYYTTMGQKVPQKIVSKNKNVLEFTRNFITQNKVNFLITVY